MLGCRWVLVKNTINGGLHNTLHNELMNKKIKNRISNVCLGGGMITSKTKINVFEKAFFTPSPLFGEHPLEKFQNMYVDFSL